MTPPVVDKISKYQHQISRAPQGVVVHATPSWKTFRPASPEFVKASFDPRAAGRRAVRRHGEALRRLAD